MLSRFVSLSRSSPISSLLPCRFTSSSFSLLPPPPPAASQFTISRHRSLPEINSSVTEYLHSPTGATVYHISRDDPERAFGVCFRTFPSDSTGVAHILEHMALCGSQSFPFRDPFFVLNRRSLRTYMNALTAPDHTMYPFATCHDKDFQNLFNVYCDAAFFPLLRKEDFAQEGHRLEWNASTNTLSRSGVVWNEMRGAMSDSSSLYYHKVHQTIFNDPNNIYHHNSGGDPQVIPSLTYDQLKQFHRFHYRPKNSVSVHYGRVPPPLIELNQLFSRCSPEVNGLPNPVYSPVSPVRSTREFTFYGPPDPMQPDPNRQLKWSISFLCHDAAFPNQYKLTTAQELDLFGLSVISTLLHDGPSAPLYQQLILSGMAANYAPNAGFDASTRQPVFSFGVSGAALDQASEIQSRVFQVLESAARDGVGLESDRIDSILHQIELNQKRVKTKYGIGLIMRIAQAFAHERDPIGELKIQDRMNAFRAHLQANPKYLSQLIDKYLLQNPDRVVACMKPQEEYAVELAQQEQARLDQLKERLNGDQLNQIVQENQQLKAAQAERIDESKLPSIGLDCVSPNGEPGENRSWSDIGLPGYFTLDQPTNDCFYIRAALNTGHLSQSHDSQRYLALYSSFLPEIGTTKRDFKEFAKAINATTGGLSAELECFSDFHSLSTRREFLLFRGMSLNRNSHHLMELFEELLFHGSFNDPTLLHQLIVTLHANLISSLQQSGHQFAKLDAAQHYSDTLQRAEVQGGIQFIEWLGQWIARIQERPEEIEALAQTLQSVHQSIIGKGTIDRFMVVAEPGKTQEFSQLAALKEKAPFKTIHALSAGGSKGASEANRGKIETLPSRFDVCAGGKFRFLHAPLDTAYAALVFPTGVCSSDPATALLDIIARLLSAHYLHPEIRERGGAYGSGASSGEGVFSFFSYRDPNPTRSVQLFQDAQQWLLKDGEITEQRLEEAKLSLFASIDAPKPPGSKGLNQFTGDIRFQDRQKMREQILSASVKDVKAVAEKMFDPKRVEQANASIVGGEEALKGVQESKVKQWQIKSLSE